MKLYRATDERYTQDAMDFDNEVERALAPIFDKYLERGASIRELSHIAQGTVQFVELMRIIDK